jgi:hypothetical protein
MMFGLYELIPIAQIPYSKNKTDTRGDRYLQLKLFQSTISYLLLGKDLAPEREVRLVKLLIPINLNFPVSGAKFP